jgi:ABC-2 type transport system permease protein
MTSVKRQPFPRELLFNLTLRQIKSTYKRSTLGFGWSMLNPIITVAVYVLVFKVILKHEAPTGDPSGLKNYGLFLVAAVVPWQFGTSALITQTNSLAANRPLLEKVYFPRWTVPLAALLAGLFDFVIELLVVILVVATVFRAPEVVLWMPALAVIVACHLGFLFGCGQVLSIYNARYRDTEHLVRLFTQIWFWLTPIIYPLSLVAESDAELLGVDLLTIYKLNPMVWFVEAYRDVLFDLRGPRLTTMCVLALWAVIPLAVGSWYFRKRQARIAESL